jgi:hypothetical protein
MSTLELWSVTKTFLSGAVAGLEHATGGDVLRTRRDPADP